MKRIAVTFDSSALNDVVKISPTAWLVVPSRPCGRISAILVTPLPPGPPGTRRVAPKPNHTALGLAVAETIQLTVVVLVAALKPTPEGSTVPYIVPPLWNAPAPSQS